MKLNEMDLACTYNSMLANANKLLTNVFCFIIILIVVSIC